MGEPQVLRRVAARISCFLLPVGGAKLLEEETESQVKGLVCV